MRSSRNTVSLQYHQWWMPAGPSRSAEGSSPRSTVWSTTASDCSSGPPREECWSRAGTAHVSAPSPPTGRSRHLPRMVEERLSHTLLYCPPLAGKVTGSQVHVYRPELAIEKKKNPPSYGWQEDLHLMSSSSGPAQPLNRDVQD